MRSVIPFPPPLHRSLSFIFRFIFNLFSLPYTLLWLSRNLRTCTFFLSTDHARPDRTMHNNAPTHVAACITSFLPTDLPLLRSQRSPPLDALSSLNSTRVRRAANVGLPRFKCHSLRSLCHQRQPPGLRRPQEDPVSCQESIGSRDICDHKARRFNATFVGHDSILRWGGIQGETWRYIPRRAGHGTSPLHSPLCTRHEHHSCLLFSYTQPRPPFPTRITSTPLPLTYHYLGICARPHILAPRHPPPP